MNSPGFFDISKPSFLCEVCVGFHEEGVWWGVYVCVDVLAEGGLIEDGTQIWEWV